MLPLLVASLLLGFICGCNTSKNESSLPIASLEPPVPAVLTQQSEEITSNFVGEISKGDFALASKLMTSNLTKTLPESRELISKSDYFPLNTAKNWKWSAIEFHDRGKSLIVHASLLDGGGKFYRTNIKLVNDGGHWLVDSILPPKAPGHGVAAHAGVGLSHI